MDGGLGVVLSETFGPLEVPLPDDPVLRRRQTLQCSVIRLSGPGDQLLPSQKLSIVEPYLWHGVHIDQGPLMQFIDNLIVFSLLH